MARQMYEFYAKNSRFCSFEVFSSKRGSKQQKKTFVCLDKIRFAGQSRLTGVQTGGGEMGSLKPLFL